MDENCQARERTQILMDVANKEGGFVVGTGDLSELALGWCTYNGDHMSMYAVNTSIPKTLVRMLVDEVGHYMDENGFAGMSKVIEDIIDTPARSCSRRTRTEPSPRRRRRPSAPISCTTFSCTTHCDTECRRLRSFACAGRRSAGAVSTSSATRRSPSGRKYFTTGFSGGKQGYSCIMLH